MKVKSFAKLNLNLYVSPPLVGGLHSLISIFQSIDLYDELIITPSTERHSVIFENMDVPDQNTCTKVFDLLKFKLKKYWSVKVIKRISDGAGLGGGSSNAATLLVALNTLESLQLSIDDMKTIAAQVGSDVPYFLYGGQAKVSGTGDIIQQNVSYSDVSKFVLILPNIHCSTATVYQTLDQLGKFDQLDNINDQDLARVGVNRLSEAAFTIAPNLSLLHHEISRLVNGQVFLSGSGSTLFVPCRSEDEQYKINALLDDKLSDFNGDILMADAVSFDQK